jgi:hypothetical protein
LANNSVQSLLALFGTKVSSQTVSSVRVAAIDDTAVKASAINASAFRAQNETMAVQVSRGGVADDLSKERVSSARRELKIGVRITLIKLLGYYGPRCDCR